MNKLSLPSISMLEWEFPEIPSTLILNWELAPFPTEILEILTLLLLGLYIFSRLVVDPKVVKTVSNRTVSKECGSELY